MKCLAFNLQNYTPLFPFVCFSWYMYHNLRIIRRTLHFVQYLIKKNNEFHIITIIKKYTFLMHIFFYKAHKTIHKKNDMVLSSIVYLLFLDTMYDGLSTFKKRNVFTFSLSFWRKNFHKWAKVIHRVIE